MRLIDSHFHSLIMNEKGILSNEFLSSISCGIDIGTEHNDIEKRVDLLSSFPQFRKSCGMGPWETIDTTYDEIEAHFEIFEENVKKYQPDFIGEFGLDNYCGYGSAEMQEYLMNLNMKCAKANGKKVIIHNREADLQTEKIICSYPEVCGVIHCFSGNIHLMKTALDLGYYISYAGNITYKANSALRETLHLVPSDRLLLETDSPYLTPVPKRGQPNTPQNIIFTYNCVAEYLGKPTEQLAEEIYRNFSDFCLPLS